MLYVVLGVCCYFVLLLFLAQLLVFDRITTKMHFKFLFYIIVSYLSSWCCLLLLCFWLPLFPKAWPKKKSFKCPHGEL